MIKAASQDDFDFIYRLYMHPDLNPFLLYEQMDEEHFLPIFEQLLADKVLYIYCVDQQAAAMFKLIPLQHRTSHIAYLGGVAVAPECAGKGVGAAMIKAIIQFTQERQIKRIELSTGVNNPRAAHLYEKCGFQREGILRNYTYLAKEDRYIDEVLMSYISL